MYIPIHGVWSRARRLRPLWAVKYYAVHRQRLSHPVHQGNNSEYSVSFFSAFFLWHVRTSIHTLTHSAARSLLPTPECFRLDKVQWGVCGFYFATSALSQTESANNTTNTHKKDTLKHSNHTCPSILVKAFGYFFRVFRSVLYSKIVCQTECEMACQCRRRRPKNPGRIIIKYGIMFTSLCVCACAYMKVCSRVSNSQKVIYANSAQVDAGV